MDVIFDNGSVNVGPSLAVTTSVPPLPSLPWCNGLIDVQTFTSSGTWIKPSNGSVAVVRCWGGGAGGQFAQASLSGSAYGGGGGAYHEIYLAVADLPGSVPVTIGAGGVGTNIWTGNWDVVPGGTTSFGSYCSAGGGAAQYGNGGTAATAVTKSVTVIGWIPSSNPTTVDFTQRAVVGGGLTVTCNPNREAGGYGSTSSGSSASFSGAGGGGGASGVFYSGGTSTYAGKGGAGGYAGGPNAENGSYPSGGGGGAYGPTSGGTTYSGSGADGYCAVYVF